MEYNIRFDVIFSPKGSKESCMKFFIDFLAKESIVGVFVRNPNFPSLEKLLSYTICNLQALVILGKTFT